MSWGWVFGGMGDRGWFEYHLHDTAEVGGLVHVVEYGATLCGRAAQPDGLRSVFCTCEDCGWAVAQRSGDAYRVPRRVAAHVQRAWLEMYVWPKQRAAIREMDRLARR